MTFDPNIKRKVQWIISDYKGILFFSDAISSDVNIIKTDSSQTLFDLGGVPNKHSALNTIDT